LSKKARKISRYWKKEIS